jgi:carboxypeptidase family protein/TonB-dependent receptor-like protein
MRWKLFSLLFLSFCAIPTFAQFKASLQGTVTDPKGAAVAGAKVSVIEAATGLARETVTSDQGFYRIALLPPGKYELTVEAPGFKRFAVNGVVVQAEEPRGFDVTLDVGAVTEQVTVNASAEALSTENANTGSAITSEEILRLPQVGRDPYELLRFTPGVFGDGSRTGNGQANNLPNSSGPGGSISSIFQIENQVQVVANGQRTATNNFTVDGVSVNSLGFGGTAVITPNQESVQEITVLSTSYSAEDGRGSGAQVKVVSKSGTDQFHGSGFFKYQDPNWNAFNAFHGPNGEVPARVNNNFRQFGASLGGPIYKNKLFFFFSYEGLRSNNLDVSAGTWVETADFRQRVAAARPGSVTAQVLTSKGVEPRIQSVLTSTCAAAGINDPTQCQAVPGGLDVGSPTGATGQYVPLDGAHFAGGGLDGNADIQFVQLALPSSTSGNQYNWRVDYQAGKNQFAFSAYLTRLNTVGSDSGGRSRPQGDIATKPQNQTEALSWVRTLSPTLVNEARLNFTRFAFNQVAANQGVDFGIPRIEIEGYNFDRIRFGADRSESTPAVFAENTINFRDTVSKVIRTHALKMGFELSAEQDNNNLLGGARPLYSNVRLWNFANDTPIFESINADPRTGGPASAQRYLRSKAIAAFFQDDWKLRPNFTLNLGLRYEYYPPLSDTKDALSNLTFGPNGLVDSSVGHVSHLIPPDHNNFGPRIGFAWSPSRLQGRSVLRGGFGVAYNRTDDVLFANARGNPPGFARFNLCCGTAATDFGTPFDGGAILYALGSSNSATSYPINPALAFGIDPANGGVCGNSACTFDQAVEIYGGSKNFRNAYVYLYSLETERRLPWNLIGSVGYQGSVGHKLTRLVNQNFLQQPNPAFFAVYFPTSDVNSNYSALNARLRRQFSQGFQFDFIYRYSKSIDQLSNEGPGAQTNQTDPAHPQTEHGPSDFDSKHNVSLTGLWDLPILRGRRDLLGTLLGGWQINGVLSAHTGFPWTPTTCVIQSVPITDAANICPTRPTALLQPPGRDTSNGAFLTPDANFPGIVHSGNCNAANGAIGGLPYFDICHPGTPGIGRNSFRGPNYFGLDFSVMKQFALPSTKLLGEGAKIELRGNFFNAFNKLNLQPIGFNTDQNRIENPRFGQSAGGLAGRVIEFQARFSF